MSPKEKEYGRLLWQKVTFIKGKYKVVTAKDVKDNKSGKEWGEQRLSFYREFGKKFIFVKGRNIGVTDIEYIFRTDRQICPRQQVMQEKDMKVLQASLVESDLHQRRKQSCHVQNVRAETVMSKATNVKKREGKRCFRYF